MKTAIVTGGAGFIGSHLVDALIKKGYKTIVVDDLSTGSKDNLNPKAEFKKMDIREPAAAALVKRLKPDVIFHLAAQASVPVSVKDPVMDAETNVMATLRLMEAAAEVKVGKFIFAGTGGALSSEKVKLPTDEKNAAAPQSPYAIAKVASEYYGAFFRAARGLPFTSFRFANVYGPRQNPHGEAGVIAIFCKRMLAKEPVRINGTGLQTRDYVYVTDVVDALLKGLDRTKTAGPYHVGTGKEASVKELFERLSRLNGYGEKPVKGPADIGAPKRSALDSRKLRRETGWKPKTSLEQGLRTTAVWFKKRA
ncbi:MAG: NAD-dependent epimerase/dehydratase family protein [Patescibacteria group bacterium]